jgi:hypothetical protein
LHEIPSSAAPRPFPVHRRRHALTLWPPSPTRLSISLQPSPERICHNEKSATISHCCLGCIQTQALAALEKAAEAATARGLPPTAAGIFAAKDVARQHPHSVALAAEAMRRATVRSIPSSVTDVEHAGGESRVSAAASVEVSCTTSSRLEHGAAAAGPASKSSVGTAFAFQLPRRAAGAAALGGAPSAVPLPSRVAELHITEPAKRGTTSTPPGYTGGAGGHGLRSTLKNLFRSSGHSSAPATAQVPGDAGPQASEDASMFDAAATAASTRQRSASGSSEHTTKDRTEWPASELGAAGVGSAAERFRPGSVIHPSIVLDCTVSVSFFPLRLLINGCCLVLAFRCVKPPSRLTCIVVV